MKNDVIELLEDEALLSNFFSLDYNGPLRSFTTGADPFVNPQNARTYSYLKGVAMADEIVYRVVTNVSSKSYSNEYEAADAIKAQICSINYASVMQTVESLLDRMNCSGSRYPQWEISPKSGYSRAFVLSCGVVQVDADNQKYKINGRDTLSQESIRGVNVKADIVEERSSAQLHEEAQSEYRKQSSTTTKQKVNP